MNFTPTDVMMLTCLITCIGFIYYAYNYLIDRLHVT